jgi:magnesium transporter
MMPIVLKKMKKDPAVASGPLIATLNDFIGLVIYFSIATLFLAIL